MNDLYNAKYFNASRRFQKNPARLKSLVGIIKQHNPLRVLDVGCGIGYLVRELRKLGMLAHGIDFSLDLEKTFWGDEDFFTLADAKNIPFEDKKFDLVFSSDFFEHLPEEDIDTVASEMKRVGQKVMALISFEADLNDEQRLYHCTNRPREWWEEKLKGLDIL